MLYICTCTVAEWSTVLYILCGDLYDILTSGNWRVKGTSHLQLYKCCWQVSAWKKRLIIGYIIGTPFILLCAANYIVVTTTLKRGRQCTVHSLYKLQVLTCPSKINFPRHPHLATICVCSARNIRLMLASTPIKESPNVSKCRAWFLPSSHAGLHTDQRVFNGSYLRLMLASTPTNESSNVSNAVNGSSGQLSTMWVPYS
jgi:hypothetical protein